MTTAVRTRLIWASLLVMAVAVSCSSGDGQPAASATLGAAPSRIGSDELAPLTHDDGAVHVAVGATHALYSTVPATSGPHWLTKPAAGAPQGSPARWGVYAEALPDEVLVHNLEHGGIGLHYNCPVGCPDTIEALRGLVSSNPSQFIVSPYPGMPTKIAVTAWRRVIYLDTVDADVIRRFMTQYKGKAPENVPDNMF